MKEDDAVRRANNIRLLQSATTWRELKLGMTPDDYREMCDDFLADQDEAFYDVVRRVTVGSRIDMFNRRQINGFERWGSEAI